MPIDGGHYFTDVIAGCAVAIAALVAALAITGQRPRLTVARPTPEEAV